MKEWKWVTFFWFLVKWVTFKGCWMTESGVWSVVVRPSYPSYPDERCQKNLACIIWALCLGTWLLEGGSTVCVTFGCHLLWFLWLAEWKMIGIQMLLKFNFGWFKDEVCDFFRVWILKILGPQLYRVINLILILVKKKNLIKNK